MCKVHVATVGLLFMGGLAACSSDDSAAVDPFDKNRTRNDSAITAYAAANNLNGQRTSSGLYYVVTTRNPAGRQPVAGEELEYTYKAYNLNNSKTAIDSVGATNPVYALAGFYRAFLPGLDEGLLLMREGERATFLIPFYIGIGAQAFGTSLPAYSVVRFDVALNRSRTEEQQMDEYLTRNRLTVTERTASGLRFIKTQNNPTGKVPTTGQTLAVRYKGLRLRGTTAFDSTTGAEVADFTLGRGLYVKGFEEGLAKLKEGEKATIIFPSSLGYGTAGRSSGNRYIITPYEPLRFDLELVTAR